jgi:hypothetical protein
MALWASGILNVSEKSLSNLVIEYDMARHAITNRGVLDGIFFYHIICIDLHTKRADVARAFEVEEPNRMPIPGRDPGRHLCVVVARHHDGISRFELIVASNEVFSACFANHLSWDAFLLWPMHAEVGELNYEGHNDLGVVAGYSLS